MVEKHENPENGKKKKKVKGLWMICMHMYISEVCFYRILEALRKVMPEEEPVSSHQTMCL